MLWRYHLLYSSSLFLSRVSGKLMSRLHMIPDHLDEQVTFDRILPAHDTQFLELRN